MSSKPNIVLWKDKEPLLYCDHEHDNKWFVVNGAWILILNGLDGIVEDTGQKVKFDKITIAPKGRDYNDILDKASLNDTVYEETND